GSRRQEKEINARISEELCAGAITSLDRDDIESLSNSLYKIPKTIEKIAERILLAPQYLQGVDFVRQTKMLEILGHLYSGKQDPIQAMFLKDLFELVEKVTDRCRDAGNTITAMVLKNS